MRLLLKITFMILLASGIQVKGQDITRLKNAKPFEISGALGGNIGAYGVSGLDYRTSPFRYGLTARLNMRIYSIDIPIYATLRDHTFNYGSSFSRFRINPQYKWIKLHIGDAYMNFNRYTLSGRTVNGVGVELTPGKFRLKMLYGKIEDLRSYADTLTLGTTFMPTYARRTAAIGIGAGTQSTFFDLYLVRTWDNLDSLNGRRVEERITRQSNTVAGTTLRIRLTNQINFQTNLGLSFQTDNLDSYGGTLTIGQNNITSGLADLNLSSHLSYAGDVGLNYTGKFFTINGTAQYVQPYYQPLSVAFINTDLVNYTVGGSMSLFQRKVNLTGSIGIQSNNLRKSKLSTSSHIIGNLAANIRITKHWSMNLNYFNFSQDFQAQLVLIEDVYTYAINNSIATGALRYHIKRDQFQYTATLRGGRNNFYTIDDNEVERGSYSSNNIGADFGVNNTEQHLRLSGGLSYRTYSRENSELVNYGARVSARKGWLNNKLGVQGIINFMFNDNRGKREGYTFRNSVVGDYRVNPVSTIGIQLSHIQRTSTIRTNFSELRADLRYMYQFNSAKR